MTLQRDYGGFDPAFFGVTISLSGEQDWILYEKLRAGESFPVEGHFFKDGLFHVLQLATAASHEIRHFHDSLIAPHSARVFRARMNMALNSLQLLGPLASSGTNCQPFPISRWCSLNDKQRKAQMRGWGKPPSGTAWTVTPMPRITKAMLRSFTPSRTVILQPGQSVLKSLALGGMWYNDRLEALARDTSHIDGDQEVHSWEIFELSALLVQMTDINNFENGRGYGWVEQFLEHISTTDSSRYGDILRIARALWLKRGETFDIYRTSLMVYWSILGDYSKDQEKASPAYRFARIWEHVAKCGCPSVGKNVQPLFKEWSNALQLSTPEDGLSHTQDLLRRLLKDLDYAVLQDVIWKEEFETLKSVVRGVVDASNHMRVVLEHHPFDYINSARYLELHSSFPNMNFRTIIDGVLKFSDERLKSTEFDVDYIEERDGGPKTIFAEVGTASKHCFVGLETTLEVATIIGLTDLFFRESGARHLEARRARRLFGEEMGKPMREVLY